MVSCRVADVGGETSLSYANAVYRPLAEGDLLVFGLKQDNTIMDAEGRTEHAGCPVLRGEKSILTIRLAEGNVAPSAPLIDSSQLQQDFFDTPVPGQSPLSRLSQRQ